MAAESSNLPNEKRHLNQERQAEIGDILLSARAVARQMISQAREQAGEILQSGRDRADKLAKEAEEAKAAALREAEGEAEETKAAVLREASEAKAAILREAEEQKAAILQEAEEQRAAILREAEEQKAAILRRAEEHAAVLLQHAEQAAAAEEEADPVPEIPEDMQEYVVRCVGDCFERLRRRQLEAAEMINEQWRSFLCGLTLTDEAAPRQTEEISSRDIEDRVGAIAEELKDFSAADTEL